MTDFVEAKPTVWRGLTFDSVLEADWAASLTVWGVNWEFHPFSLELSDGRVYEPDFLLHNAAAWGEDILLEVKGPHDNRIDKPILCQEMFPELIVLIGRVPYLSADYINEYAAAVWHRPDHSRYDWELNGRLVEYVSGEHASEKNPGLSFFKAIANSRHIK